MQYGDQAIKVHPIADFQGDGSATAVMFMNLLKKGVRPVEPETCPISKSHARVSSRDAALHHYFAKYQDSYSHEHALKLQKELSERMTIDHAFKEFEI